MKIQKKSVRKKLDVSNITAETVEALIGYLGLSGEDTNYDVNKKLAETL